MNKVIVMCDSTADLSPDLIAKNDIHVVPLHVTFQGDATDYLDGVTLTSEQVYEKAEASGTTPKTGAINVFEMQEYFRPYIEQGYDIIFTGIGSGLSSTYANAVLASRQFPEGRIEVVDSWNLSTGTGLLVLKMCTYRDQGDDVHAIAEKVRKLVPFVSAKFCIDRLDYLYKGGRCSGFTMALAHMLHVHPVAKMVENKLVVYRKIRGKYRRAVDEQIREFMEDLPRIDKSAVFITDSGHMDGEDEYIREKIKAYVPEENIFHTRAGCVVSSHCGPKTIGILYILDPEK